MIDYTAMNYNELAAALVELKDQKEDYAKRVKYLNSQIDKITIEVLPDKLAEDGFRSVNLANGGQIKLSPQAYCSTRAGQKDALFSWMMDHGFEDLITEVINASTLKAFVKEQTEQGNPVPPDEIVNYQPYTRASVVGVKSESN